MPTPIPEDEGKVEVNMSALHIARLKPKEKYMRRCQSEDPGARYRTPSPRIIIDWNSPHSNEDIKTPLLEENEEDDVTRGNNFTSSKGFDETDTDSKSLRNAVRHNHRRRLSIVKNILFGMTVFGLICCVAYIFCTRKNFTMPEAPKCEIFEAILDEKAIENDGGQYEYNLPWLNSRSVNSSLTHIKCSKREFVALQKGKYTIHLKIHIDTYQWTHDLTKEFPLKLCMMSNSSALYCTEKRQAIKEVDTMDLYHVTNMEKGQKFRFLLRTDEKPKDIIKSSNNRVQIHPVDCYLRK